MYRCESNMSMHVPFFQKRVQPLPCPRFFTALGVTGTSLSLCTFAGVLPVPKIGIVARRSSSLYPVLYLACDYVFLCLPSKVKPCREVTQIQADRGCLRVSCTTGAEQVDVRVPSDSDYMQHAPLALPCMSLRSPILTVCPKLERISSSAGWLLSPSDGSKSRASELD